LFKEKKNMETRVAVISIIVESGAVTESLNELLSSASKYIIGRMGIPYRSKGFSIINIAIDAPQDAINRLAGGIGRLSGVSAKTVYAPARTPEN
jgi:putative iron-only hydrogenase system regulator